MAAEDVAAGDVRGAGRRQWLGLAVLALPTLLVSIDVFVLLLALPRLSSDLGASSVQQLWITDIYAFMVSGFLITMGALGDRIGRRRLLLYGAATFGAASVVCAYAPDPVVLIVARAVLGVAGATLLPSTLALITTMFPDDRQRATAIGVWGSCFMVGAVVGPVVGGLVLEHFWWGSVFLLGVPTMVLLLIAGPALLPEYRVAAAGRVDLPSVALSLAATLPFIYGVKEVARDGWRPSSVVACLVGAAFGAAFVRRQRRLTDPLLDLRLFRNGALSAALVAMLSYAMLTGTMMYFLTQYLQLVNGLSPLRAALGLVPGMLVSAASFQITPVVARRVRPAYLIAGGFAGVAVIYACFTQVGAAAGPAPLIAGFAVWCLCGGPVIVLGTNVVVGSARPEQAGSAASISQSGSEFGNALGVALIGSLGVAVYRAAVPAELPAGLSPAQAAAARDTMTGARAAAGSLPPQTGAALLDAVQPAYVAAMHVVAAVGAVLLAVVAVLVAVKLRGVPPLGRAAAPAEVPAGPDGGDPPVPVR